MKINRFFFWQLFWILTGVLCGAIDDSHGANCGGATTCACGDTVTSSYTMGANLTCSSGQGLVIGTDGITLDCASFDITRSPTWVNGNPDSDYGIYLSGVTGDQVTGVTVKNCNDVTGWKIGVRFKEASSNTLKNSNIHDNGDAATQQFYNVEITQNSHNNSIDTVILDNAGDENLHCSGATGTSITGSTFTDAQNENLYFLSCNNSTVTTNTFGPGGASPGSNSGYIKDSSNNTFTGNTWQNKVLTIVGTSSNNSFTDISANAGVRLEHYEETPGDQNTYRFPQGNIFTGMAISATTDCLRVENATGTLFSGGSLATCATRLNAASLDSMGVSYKPTDITFINLDPYAGVIAADGGVTINVGYTLNVHVQKTGPIPLDQALVTLVDAKGTTVFAISTNASGDIPQQNVTVRSGRMPIKVTPHRMLVVRPAYVTSSQDLNLTAATNQTITLTAQ